MCPVVMYVHACVCIRSCSFLSDLKVFPSVLFGLNNPFVLRLSVDLAVSLDFIRNLLSSTMLLQWPSTGYMPLCPANILSQHQYLSFYHVQLDVLVVTHRLLALHQCAHPYSVIKLPDISLTKIHFYRE